MAIRIYQVDTFTQKPFTGNPAAVCLLSSPKADLWMQQVASEMNLSETAFLLEQEIGIWTMLDGGLITAGAVAAVIGIKGYLTTMKYEKRMLIYNGGAGF